MAQDGTKTSTALDIQDLAFPEQLNLVVARLARQLRQAATPGLSPTQAGTLFALDRGGSMTLGELAAAERVQPPTMTVTVDRLEAQGLVRRSPDRADRRVVRVELTAAGRRTLMKRRAQANVMIARRLDMLTPSQLATLAKAVEVFKELLALEDDEPLTRTEAVGGSNGP